MSTEVVKVIDASEIESKNVEVGEWGLEFKGQLTPQEWYETALAIQKFDGKLQWYLGDLAVYAKSEITGWGESKYDDLIAATGYAPQTLRTYASVARRFPLSFRENLFSALNMFNISFGHFQEVASLDDNFAAYWLSKANDNAWGRDKFREEIIKWKIERGDILEKEEKPIGYVTFKEQQDKFFKGYFPNLSQEEYDTKTWLLEVYDVVGKELQRLGIISG